MHRATTGEDARAALAATWWSAATGDGAHAPAPEVVMLAVRRTDVSS
ncbi:MAG TPA: hypothetical protein VKP64_09265 [Mycobacteriales bacterium]|nr:hypothetical protein [Mycobacteriales bacterium]